MKPLLDYAPYLEETDADINQLVSGASYCSNSYCPKNYSGRSYGMVTLRTAFAQSYNTPAIRLFEKTGWKRVSSTWMLSTLKRSVKKTTIRVRP
ncbi:hypothetical protein Q5O89_03065 [Peribacillus frigoritolerans]|nr:hypothetical protein [Peribacillus frigoritolerans]